MDYGYYLWGSYACVLLGLGWLVWDTLIQAKRLRHDFHKRSEQQ